MSKRKILKEQEECFEEVPIVVPSKKIKSKKFDLEEKLRDKDFVAKAFF